MHDLSKFVEELTELYVYIQISEHIYVSRLTVVSREAKKKQYACASSGLCDHRLQ